MRFTIPFQYIVKFVPPRHKNHQSARFASSVEVEIKEVSKDDAPVVMKVGQKRVSHVDRFAFKEDESLREIRMMGGKFYVEAGDTDSLIRSAQDIGLLNGTYFGDIKPLKNPGRNQYSDVTTMTRLRALNGGLREELTEDDKGEKVANALRRKASELLSIDGVIFEMCREPIMQANLSSSGSLPKIVEAPISIRNDDPSGDDYAQALCSLPEWLEFSEKHRIDSRKTQSFEIIDPECSGFDGLTHDIFYATQYIRKTLNMHIDGMFSTAYSALQTINRIVDENAAGEPALSNRWLDAIDAVSRIKPNADTAKAYKQLSEASYFKAISGNDLIRKNLRGAQVDAGTGLKTGLGYVGDRRRCLDEIANASKAALYIKNRFALRNAELFPDGKLPELGSMVAADSSVVREYTLPAQIRKLSRMSENFQAVAESAMNRGDSVLCLYGKPIRKYDEVKGVSIFIANPVALAQRNFDGAMTYALAEGDQYDAAGEALSSYLERESELIGMAEDEDMAISVL